jgi:hypothetical protein
MITVVNGYICYCSCDVAKAEQNKNPRTPPGDLPDSSNSSNQTPTPLDQPATVLSGVLANLSQSSTDAANTVDSTNPRRHSLNVLV